MESFMKYFRFIHLAWLALICVFLYQEDFKSAAYMFGCIAMTEISVLFIFLSYQAGKDDKP
jgi:hypothetical protein